MAHAPERRSDAVDVLRRALTSEIVFAAGDSEYDGATRPDNASYPQRPALVVRPRSAQDVATTVATAREVRLRVAAQATGHGAGGPLDGGVVLVDTSSLGSINVDPSAATVRVGAGVTWGEVQVETEKRGLFALSGTSPTVGVCGYTVHGGVGWLVRPFGLASASLRAVEYVDGLGTIHRTDDSGDATPDALWAFRGGASVGIATELEFALFPVADLWAGYLLWPAGQLTGLTQAWLDSVRDASDALTSTLSVLRLPPEGPFPPELLGSAVVHLSYASTDGEPGLAPMRAAMRAVAEPAEDTTGACDAARLARIHLDPPGAVPGRGFGAWLDHLDTERLVGIFGSARIGQRDGLNMIEVRHVGSPASRSASTDGALTSAPAPYLVHAVGAAADDDARREVDGQLARVEDAIVPVSAGRAAPAFRDGQPDSGTVFPPELAERLLDAVHGADPDRVLLFQRAP